MMGNLQEQIRAAEADLSIAEQRLRDLRAQIPKPPPVCQACGRPATWEGYYSGDYEERYCAEHYHEYVKFPDGDMPEWAAAVAGEKLVAAEARVAELEALLAEAVPQGSANTRIPIPGNLSAVGPCRRPDALAEAQEDWPAIWPNGATDRDGDWLEDEL